MKKLIKLPFISKLHDNLNSTPQFCQVILGPRQVGKTTSVLHFLEHEYTAPYVYVSADSILSANNSWLIERWQQARAKNATIVIDEIQKVHNWAETIKSLWDEEKRRPTPIKCILLGSSSLDIQKGLTESLTGRFQLIRAHHWNFSESHAAYEIDFEQYLQFGGYPASYVFLQAPDEWNHYVQSSIVSTVIEKDILSNHTVRSPALFKQAFEILISYPAQEISYTKILGQLQDKGNTELIKHYISLFEGAYLVRALEKFSNKSFIKKSSSPKILPLCPAFYYLTLQSRYTPEERGRAFELLVGCQLNRTGLELYYWREGSHEVDFVLKKGKEIWAIEVKSGRKRSQRGLEKFQESFPQSKSVIISPENYLEFEKNPLGFLEKVT